MWTAYIFSTCKLHLNLFYKGWYNKSCKYMIDLNSVGCFEHVIFCLNLFISIFKFNFFQMVDKSSYKRETYFHLDVCSNVSV